MCLEFKVKNSITTILKPVSLVFNVLYEYLIGRFRIVFITVICCPYLKKKIGTKLKLRILQKICGLNPKTRGKGQELEAGVRGIQFRKTKGDQIKHGDITR